MAKSGFIKTEKDIEGIRASGTLLASVLEVVIKAVKPGVTTKELDTLAERLMIASGGRPAFKGYGGGKDVKPFPSTLCISIDHEVVHGPAIPARTIQDGSLVGIDIGVQYPAKGGFYTDMAKTVIVGSVDEQSKKLVRVTEEALARAIKQVRPGAHISDIGKTVQAYVESQDFSVVRDLVGHGVGYAVHEDPAIPNFWEKGMKDIELKQGMVIAIEPMVNAGGWQVYVGDDKWTIMTADNSLSAHFEHTIIITKNGAEVATKL